MSLHALDMGGNGTGTRPIELGCVVTDAKAGSSAVTATTTSQSNNITVPDLWTSILAQVSTSKQLTQKYILVLGGTNRQQEAFVRCLNVPEAQVDEVVTAGSGGTNTQGHVRVHSHSHDVYTERPPIANKFALGYTYVNFHETDIDGEDDVFARLSFYFLREPNAGFCDLARTFLLRCPVEDSLIVCLLDWSKPWLWLRELRAWIRFIRQLRHNLPRDCEARIDANIEAWKRRARCTTWDSSTASSAVDDVPTPLGPGEWDVPLALPLCVVAQNTHVIDTLAKERGWSETEFDFVLQTLRTILLRHGAALVYTPHTPHTGNLPTSLQPPSPTTPSSAGASPGLTQSPIRDVIQAMLGIRDVVRKERPLRHNVIDRDRVCIPPNWDSWGKIRVLRDGFDVESVSKAWSRDLQLCDETLPATSLSSVQSDNGDDNVGNSAVTFYEQHIQQPSSLTYPVVTLHTDAPPGIELHAPAYQTFLESQLKVLEHLQTFDRPDPLRQNSLPYPPSANLTPTPTSTPTPPIDQNGNDAPPHPHCATPNPNPNPEPVAVVTPPVGQSSTVPSPAYCAVTVGDRQSALSESDSTASNDLVSFFSGLAKRSTSSLSSS